MLTGCQLLDPIFKTLRTHEDFKIWFGKIWDKYRTTISVLNVTLLRNSILKMSINGMHDPHMLRHTYGFINNIILNSLKSRNLYVKSWCCIFTTNITCCVLEPLYYPSTGTSPQGGTPPCRPPNSAQTIRLCFPSHLTQAQGKATDESGGPNTYRNAVPLPSCLEALAVMHCPDSGDDVAEHVSCQWDHCQDQITRNPSHKGLEKTFDNPLQHKLSLLSI